MESSAAEALLDLGLGIGTVVLTVILVRVMADILKPGVVREWRELRERQSANNMSAVVKDDEIRFRKH